MEHTFWKSFSKITLIISLLLILVLSFSNLVLYSTPIFATNSSTNLYEYYNTGGNSDSIHIYGPNWDSQTFTVGTSSHSITDIQLMIKRVGTTPGLVTIAIQATNTGVPISPDLASATYDGNALNTDYSLTNFTLTSELSINASITYSIIIRDISGDSSNYVLVQQNSAGGYTGGAVVHSANSGLTWTSEATDSIFKVYGKSLLSIVSAAVFNNYAVDSSNNHTINDLLITVNIINTYTPYYPNQLASQYFSIQLLDLTGTTILASDPISGWGNNPVSMYIGPNLTSQLTQGGEYIIRLMGTFTGAPTDITYALQSSDWHGTDLSKLYDWCITTAKTMETYYSDLTNTTVTFVTSVNRSNFLWIGYNSTNVLNQSGGAIFDAGISGLSTIIPNLFQTLISTIKYKAEGFNPTMQNNINLETNIGPTIYADATKIANIFDLSAKDVLLIFWILVYAILVFWLLALNQIGIGLIVGFPWMMWGTYLGIVDVIIIGTIASLSALYIVYHVWFERVM
jgi:hypothetical protein